MTLYTTQKDINHFVNGTLLILESVSNYKNEEELNIVLNIFNGDKGDGTTVNLYQEVFEMSFDDEVSTLQNFVYEFLEDDLLQSNFSMFHFSNEGKNILSLIAGLELSKRSLVNLVKLCDEYEKLKKYVENYVFNEDKHDEYFTNPFHKRGIHAFKERFNAWSDAFQKDIELIIGKEKFEAIQNEAQAYVNSQYPSL